ncbi:MAG: ATP-binding protein, partial [Acidobacteriota bacterium]
MPRDTISESVVSIELRLPAAILRFWTPDPSSQGSVEEDLGRLVPAVPGFHNLSPGTVAITAESGDPAIFDSAVYLGEQLIEGARRRGTELRLLILPGEVVRHGEKVELATDALIESSPTWFSGLEPGKIHMTSWTVHMREQPSQVREIRTQSGTPSEHSLPIFQTESALSDVTPWRNPDILNRKIRFVARDDLSEKGSSLLSEPAWRIEVPVGCGKSYFAHHLLASAAIPRIWLRGAPAHRRRFGLTRQLLDQLGAASKDSKSKGLTPVLGDLDLLQALRHEIGGVGEDPSHGGADQLPTILQHLTESSEGPFYLVCDDLQLNTEDDLEALEGLLGRPELGRGFRLLLIGRGGRELPNALTTLPMLTVGPFEDDEMSQFSSQLFSGLSLPASTRDRLHDSTSGCPFALEEGMFALIREKSLRRVYGSFFFAGQDSAGFSPSPRFLCHLQAEAYRLAIEEQLQLLSIIDGGSPQSIIGRSASRFGGRSRADWDLVGSESGLLESVDTPWGPGVDFTCSAFGATLAHGVAPDALPQLRTAIGSILASESKSGEANWESYRLLKSTEEGVGALIKTLESSYSSQIPSAELLEVLTQELYRHRERRGSAEIELSLLWKL